MICSKKRFNFV